MPEKSLENSLDSKEIKPVNPKGNQPWILTGRTMLKLKLQYFGHLMQRADSLEKTDAGKDWGQEEKGATAEVVVGWHHQQNGHESEHEGGNRTGSVLQAGLHLGPDCGLWALCPVSMEMTHQLENRAPGRKSPRALHRLEECPNHLCNRIESYLLLYLLGYDHRPIDNCPLLTT